MWERNAVVGLAAIALACAPPPAQPPTANRRGDVARPVPTHVLTLHDAGTITTAEQGDFIEIRLNEPPSGGTWRLSNRLGDARLEAEGADRVVQKETGPIRIFRFRALGVGRSELSFTLFAPESAAPVRELKFMFAVR